MSASSHRPWRRNRGSHQYPGGSHVSALAIHELQAVAETSAAGSARRAVSAPRECLIFRLGEEEYGIDILRVQEIRSYEQPTRIAGAPPFIKGVIDLRGVIVPVVDLRLKF